MRRRAERPRARVLGARGRLWERQGAPTSRRGLRPRGCAGLPAAFEALARIHSERGDWAEAAEPSSGWPVTRPPRSAVFARLQLAEACVALGNRSRAQGAPRGRAGGRRRGRARRAGPRSPHHSVPRGLRMAAARASPRHPGPATRRTPSGASRGSARRRGFTGASSKSPPRQPRSCSSPCRGPTDATLRPRSPTCSKASGMGASRRGAPRPGGQYRTALEEPSRDASPAARALTQAANRTKRSPSCEWPPRCTPPTRHPLRPRPRGPRCRVELDVAESTYRAAAPRDPPLNRRRRRGCGAAVAASRRSVHRAQRGRGAQGRRRARRRSRGLGGRRGARERRRP